MNRPLQVNPIKLSQPIGAALAFLGIDRCMPLMHGGQGCTSFTKVFFTRHFAEPIAIQTTAVTDVTAILDGGDTSIVEAVRNITRKVTPELIGLFTTGLTETKGDDIRGIATQIDFPLVHVNTPDYEGGLESGWAATTKAIIDQLVDPADSVDTEKVVILPNVSLQAIEVEKIREFVGLFGFEVHALPDLSTSLDGHLAEKQAALSSGGIAVDTVRELGDAGLAITIGDSMRRCGEAIAKKNPGMRQHHVSHLNGLAATDDLVEMLLRERGLDAPPAAVARWRRRLLDALLDSHFSLGQTRFCLTGEPDQLAGWGAALAEAGGRIELAIATVPSPQLERIDAATAGPGDLEDAEKAADRYDLIVGNVHCEALAHRLGKGLMLRGYPNWERIGHQLKNNVLYEGGCYLLFEAANTATEFREKIVGHQDTKNTRKNRT